MYLEDGDIDFFMAPVFRQFIKEERHEPAAASFVHFAVKSIEMARYEADLIIGFRFRIGKERMILNQCGINDFDVFQTIIIDMVRQCFICIVRSRTAKAVGYAVSAFDDSCRFLRRHEFLLIFFCNL